MNAIRHENKIESIGVPSATFCRRRELASITHSNAGDSGGKYPLSRTLYFIYYYDASMSYRTDCDSLTIFDQPTFTTNTFVQGKGETWRATFKDFVICGGKVVREINWVRQESPQAKTYIVKPIKTPTPADYAPFQKLSSDQGYAPWP